jgi:hypothetical protein
MFAIQLMGLNLNNNTSRYFDIFMVERHFINGGMEMTNNTINMVPCTSKHFSLTDQIAQNFASLPSYQWLCPPLNYSFPVEGKYTSPSIKLLEIRVAQCNSTLDPLRPCLSNPALDAL